MNTRRFYNIFTKVSFFKDFNNVKSNNFWGKIDSVLILPLFELVHYVSGNFLYTFQKPKFVSSPFEFYFFDFNPLWSRNFYPLNLEISTHYDSLLCFCWESNHLILGIFFCSRQGTALKHLTWVEWACLRRNPKFKIKTNFIMGTNFKI